MRYFVISYFSMVKQNYCNMVQKVYISGMEKEMTVRENCARAGRAGRGDCKRRSSQMRAYWRKVKAGEIKHRGRGRSKPKQAELPLNSGGVNG